MSYASIEDLTIRLGKKSMVQLTNYNEPRATTVNETVAQAAIDSGQGIIDGFIGQRLSLPLTEVSGFVETIAKDLAHYYLKAPKGITSDSALQKLHDNAIAHLKSFADGDISLGLEIPDPAANDAGGDVAEISSAPRRNTRESLGRLT